MAMETVTNYVCDRCGRSEIKDQVEIMTLTVRKRTSGTPGQGAAVITKHICAQNCLKIVKASMDHVGRPGRKPGSKINNGTDTQPTTARKRATKGGTKNASAARTSKITATPAPASKKDPFNALPAHVRAVRVKTRTPQGGFAPGYNYRSEAKMIKEAEARISADK